MHVARWKHSVRARITAFALAAAFLWICTGGTLRHSDDCACCAPIVAASQPVSHSGHAGVHRSDRDNDGNMLCAACQWIQVARDLPADHALSIAATTIAYEPFAPALPALPSVQAVRHASLRAPPRQTA